MINGLLGKKVFRQ